MGSFWDRRLAEIKGQPAPRPSPVTGVSYGAGPGGTQAPAQYGGPSGQQLAVHQAKPAERELAEHIQRTGYIASPPSWVRRQPTDRCPNCGSPDYAAVSAGGYAMPGAPGSILRCFDCNYSSGRGVSALWGLPPSGPVAGRAVQSRDGTVSLRNTGLITA